MSVAEGTRGWAGKQEALIQKLRDLSKIALEYKPTLPMPYDGDPINLWGHSPATLTHAVYKTSEIQSEYLQDQALYMEYLGESVCPKILSINPHGYSMEYLHARVLFDSEFLSDVKEMLSHNVWNRSSIIKETDKWKKELKETIDVDVPDWAHNEERCLIHGDCTLDNVLLHPDGVIRITDPIPPQYLNRPSIASVDEGRILQSFLGWEVLLRRNTSTNPYSTTWLQKPRKAIFWCMVTLKRIAAKDTSSAGHWANRIAGELECML